MCANPDDSDAFDRDVPKGTCIVSNCYRIKPLGVSERVTETEGCCMAGILKYRLVVTCSHPGHPAIFVRTEEILNLDFKVLSNRDLALLKL